MILCDHNKPITAARRNVIVERARLNRRKQHPGEPIETFIQDLHRLAENCEYGTLKDELIRDIIIVGVLDDALFDRLQAKPKLAEAVRMSRESEARQQNRTVVRGEQPDDVSFIKPTKEARWSLSKRFAQQYPPNPASR